MHFHQLHCIKHQNMTEASSHGCRSQLTFLLYKLTSCIHGWRDLMGFLRDKNTSDSKSTTFVSGKILLDEITIKTETV